MSGTESSEGLAAPTRLSDSRPLWVVGDNFVVAAEHERVMTPRALLSHADALAFAGRAYIQAGQGMEQPTWEWLRGECEARAPGAGRAFGLGPPQAVPRHRVHKRSQANVVIADARTTGPSSARCALHVVNDSTMCRDFTAERQHLPGLLLIEAASQLVTWATAELFPLTTQRPPQYTVMTACRFTFRHFVLPVAVTLHAGFVPAGEATPHKVPLRGSVDIEQCGQVAARCSFEFCAHEPQRVFALEAAQAQAVYDVSMSRSSKEH